MLTPYLFDADDGYMIAFILTFMLFTGIGLGLTLYMRGDAKRLHPLWIAPTVGFGLTSLVITHSVYLFDIAIAHYIMPFLIGLLGLSILLSLTFLWRYRKTEQSLSVSPMIYIFIVSVVAVGLFLLLPSMVGGANYRLWHGNMYDWVNYNLMAFYRLNFDSTSFNSITEFQPLKDIMPALYYLGRPGVSYVLGWLSGLYNIPIYDLYFYYALALVLQILPMGFALGQLLKLGMRQSLLLGIVLTVGFWTYIVVDINALSQVSSISLLILFIYTWIDFEQHPSPHFFSRERLVLALSGAFLFILYPELTPLLALSIVLYYGLQVINQPSKTLLRGIASHGITLVLVGIFTFPVMGHTLSYLLRQVNVGSSNVAEVWHLAYFSWLYHNHEMITNLWGLHPYLGIISFSDTSLILLIFSIMLILLTLSLLTLLAIGMVRALINPTERPKATILTTGIISYWGIGLLMQFIDRQWTGAKFILMGAPFVVVALFVFYQDFIGYRRVHSKQSPRIYRLMTFGVSLFFGVWILTQALTPIIRTYYIAQPANIPHYPILGVSEYDDISPIINILQSNPDNIVYSTLSASQRSPGDSVWQWMFTQNSREHIGFNGVYYNQDMMKPITDWQQSDNLPTVWVFDTELDMYYQSGLGEMLTDGDYFRAYRVSPEALDAINGKLSLLNVDMRYQHPHDGFGLLFTTEAGVISRWMTNKSAYMRFVASGKQPFMVYMAGVSAYDGTMQILLEDTQNSIAEILMTPETPIQFTACFMPTAGTNDMMLTPQGTMPNPDETFLIDTFWVVPAVSRLDIGYELTDHLTLQQGWESGEQWGEETVRWANRQAQARMFTCSDIPTHLYFRAFYSPELHPDPQTVTITINDVMYEPITLNVGWHEYEIAIQDGTIIPNQPQIITLDHAWGTTPLGDTRSLALAYDWFEWGILSED